MDWGFTLFRVPTRRDAELSALSLVERRSATLFCLGTIAYFLNGNGLTQWKPRLTSRKRSWSLKSRRRSPALTG